MKTNQIIFIVIILLLIVGFSYFSVKYMYSENFMVDLHESRCIPGHELVWNDKDKKMNCKECEAGMYSCNGSKCKPCGYNQWSEKGATKCKTKSVCNNNLKDTRPTFENIEINDIPKNLLESLYSYEEQYIPSGTKSTEFKNNIKSLIKNNIKNNISTELDKGNDRECVKLNKCDLTQYSPNYITSYINDFTPNPDMRTIMNTKIFMEDLKCENLNKCLDNQYWYNYNTDGSSIDSMKYQQESDGVYSTDRQCKNLTNCEPGKYHHNRLNKVSDLYIEDRMCQDCDGKISDSPNYTDTPNQTICALQKKCEPGQYVNPKDISSVDGSLVIDKQIDCEPCGNFFYTDKANFDATCNEQTKCPAGKYDKKLPPTNKARIISGCDDCVCDTYTDGSSHVTKCAIQPTIGALGIGSVGYIGDAGGGWSGDYDVLCTTNKRMITENCDGDEYYQDEIGHRNPCKEHITCDKGELISPTNPVKTRMCEEISTQPYLENCSSPSGNCLYMPYVTHRVQEGLSQTKCPLKENKLLYEVPSKFTKEKIDCKSMRQIVREMENTDKNLII